MSEIGGKPVLRYKTYVKQIQGLYEQPVAQTSIALILTLVTVAFFGLAAIRPTLATVSELIKEIEQKREVDEKLGQKIGALSSVQEEYFAIQDKLPLLDTAIPADRERNLLLLQMEYLTWLNNITVENMRIDPMTVYSKTPEPPEKTTDIFPSFTLVLTVAAPDELAHRTLLEDISNLDRLLRIESVSFSRPEDEEDNTVKMTTTIRAYYQNAVVAPVIEQETEEEE